MSRNFGCLCLAVQLVGDGAALPHLWAVGGWWVVLRRILLGACLHRHIDLNAERLAPEASVMARYILSWGGHVAHRRGAGFAGVASLATVARRTMLVVVPP